MPVRLPVCFGAPLVVASPPLLRNDTTEIGIAKRPNDVKGPGPTILENGGKDSPVYPLET